MYMYSLLKLLRIAHIVPNKRPRGLVVLLELKTQYTRMF